MSKEKKKEIIAVTFEDRNKWGCPYCGYRSGASTIDVHNCSVWICGDCGKTCALLGEGITISKIGFGNPAVHPELQEHPRKGTPAHGGEDKRPEGDGEFFNSRGIGMDTTPGCFVCGGDAGLHTNICAFVQCKESGERIVAMFKSGARLDFRENEPDRVQVKIGACGNHLPNLKMLNDLTHADEIITAKMIEESKE